jgi:hypothetical protein
MQPAGNIAWRSINKIINYTCGGWKTEMDLSTAAKVALRE